MPFTEDEERSISDMKGRGVPKEFSRWAVSYLSGSGYDHQAYDVESRYDPGISFQENKSEFRQRYPSKPAEQYAREITHSEREHFESKGRDTTTYLHGHPGAAKAAAEFEIERSKEPSELDRRFKEMEKERTPKEKEEWFREKLLEKTKAEAEVGKARVLAQKLEAKKPSELDEDMAGAAKREGFMEKAGAFIDTQRSRWEKSKEIREKTKAEAEVGKARALAQKLDIAKTKAQIRDTERALTRERAEELGYKMKGGATGEMFFQKMDFLGKRAQPGAPTQRRFVQDDSLARRMDITAPREAPSRSPRYYSRSGLDLDITSQPRSPMGRRQPTMADRLNIFSSSQPQPQSQKHIYRWVDTGGGVMRRKRFQVDPQTGQPYPEGQAPQRQTQANGQQAFLGKYDMFARDKAQPQNGTRRFALQGPSLEKFSQGTRMNFLGKTNTQFIAKRSPGKNRKKPKSKKPMRFL